MADSLQPHGLKSARFLCPWNFPGKNTGVDCHFLLQGIFLTQWLNLCLLLWQANSLPQSHQWRRNFWKVVLGIKHGILRRNKRMAYSSSVSCSVVSYPLATPWIVALFEAPLSMEFSRQEYWSGLPLPSPGDLPNLGIEPRSLGSSALLGNSFTIWDTR